MNIIKIAVDELPKNCHECELIQNYVNSESDCSITHQVASYRSRRFDCPLVVEECCEWKYTKSDNDDYRWRVFRSCKPDGKMLSNGMSDKYCKDCGRKIKNVEVE